MTSPDGLRNPLTPSILTGQDSLVIPPFQLSLGHEYGFLVIEKLQEQEPRKVLHVFHDPAAVVVAAHDVASPKDCLTELVTVSAISVHHSTRYKRRCNSRR